MTLKDQLVADIEASRIEAKRKRRATLPDSEWWEEIREAEIKPALVEAVSAFGETKLGGNCEARNGVSGIALLAGHSEPPIHHLTFTHVAGEIKVISSESNINDRWNRKHATLEAVASKIRDFVKLVAPKIEPESVYERRGMDIIDMD